MKLKMQKGILLCFILFNATLICGQFDSDFEFSKKPANQNLAFGKSLQPYLLPKEHPLQDQLAGLFTDSRMFRSPRYLKKAGFEVIEGHRHLMVGFHSSIPGYLIKKFSDDVSNSRQLKNYLQRIDGAEVLRKYIKEHNFKHLVVPRKWLYKLPKEVFEKSQSYLLIVEKMDIYDDWDNPEGEARTHYKQMDSEMVTELCTILYEVGGCDAFPWNQPMTRSEKIAFVDTEHVGLKIFHHYFIKNIVPALNEDQQTYAIALWEKLKKEDRHK